MSELLLKSESYQVIGACFEVYKLVNFGHHPKVDWERIVR